MDTDTFLREVALKQAVTSGAPTAKDIVEAAKLFYEFMRNESSSPITNQNAPIADRQLPPVEGFTV